MVELDSRQQMHEVQRVNKWAITGAKEQLKWPEPRNMGFGAVRRSPVIELDLMLMCAAASSNSAGTR